MRTTILAAAAALAVGFAVPAQAGHKVYPPVPITLDVSIGHDEVDHARCSLNVPRDHHGFANGFDALDEAVKRGCIESYDAPDSGYGRFLTCIDDWCGEHAPTWVVPVPVAYAGTLWSFTVNGSRADVGLDGHKLLEGQEIGLTYEPYLCSANPFRCAT